jgi:DNA repair exonuclease SbcCD ATPase subunit
MIRRLHLQGWRAFEELTLHLEDGLTFVVAENGVGKTSLVQAAAWGLYGEYSGIDARAARRIGASATRVEVDVELPDGRTLTIARQVEERSTSTHAHVGRTTLGDDDLARILAGAFGASPEFLSKTTIVPSDGVISDATGAFHLQAHLSRVLGVDDLNRAADELQGLHRQAETAAKAYRQATRRAAADLSLLRADLAKLEASEPAAETARASAQSAVASAERASRVACENAAARAKAATVGQEFAKLLASSLQVFDHDAIAGKVQGPTELVALLDAAESAATDELDEHRREAATIAGRLDAVRAAATEIRSAEAECPVCRRQLSPEDVAHAEMVHQRELHALTARERELTLLVQSASERLKNLRQLSRQASRLADFRIPLAEPAVGVDEAEHALDAARQRAEQLADEAADVRARRKVLATRIAEDERAARESHEAYTAHKREAVTSVAAEVMRSSANAILAERIDPLTTEITHRWKQVFMERGSLRLHPDGRLVIVRGVHEIPFGQFSSGEKVVALLAVRLLILGASTRASFMWLDEPLEHLDPKNRRITASLMTATGKHVRQVLITTYEETLARRLAATTSAHLRYVRAAGG